MIITWWKGLYVADKPDTLELAAKLLRGGWKEHVPEFGCDKYCKPCTAKIGRRFYAETFEVAAPFAKYFNTTAKDQGRTKLALIEKSRSIDSRIAIPAPDGLEYLGYQKAGIEYAIQRKDTLIGDEMGLGKTIQALGFVNKVCPKNVVVVCPKSVKYNWLDEAQKWLVGKYEFHIADNTSEPANGANFIIVNYEKLIKPSALVLWMQKVWDLIVVDEAHALKNPQSQRSLAILGAKGLALMRRARRSLYLTGTPIMNAPRELWPILSAISPAQFGDRQAFLDRYCQPKFNPKSGIVEYNGGTNLEELQTRLRTTCMVRRLKKDVLKDLPPKMRQIISLDNPLAGKDPAMERFKKIVGDRIDKAEAALEAAKTETEFKAAVKEMDLVVGVAFEEMAKFRHETAKLKIDPAIEYIQNYLEQTQSKIIVFAHHKTVLEKLSEAFAGVSVGVWGNGDDESERASKVKEFQNNPEIKIFIGGLKAAGVGITLTAASTVIFVEGDWTPATMLQAEDRAHRIGQTNPVHVIQLVLRDTLDANMAKHVLRKMMLIEKTLDKKVSAENVA